MPTLYSGCMIDGIGATAVYLLQCTLMYIYTWMLQTISMCLASVHLIPVCVCVCLSPPEQAVRGEAVEGAAGEGSEETGVCQSGVPPPKPAGLRETERHLRSVSRSSPLCSV